MARPISSSREAVLGDLVELVAADLEDVVAPGSGGSRRRRRRGRSRRSPRCTSTRCRPGRASPGPPGRGGSSCRRRGRCSARRAPSGARRCGPGPACRGRRGPARSCGRAARRGPRCAACGAVARGDGGGVGARQGAGLLEGARGPGVRPCRGRRCRRRRRPGGSGRSASCRSGRSGPRSRALTVSTVPRTGRPSGVSPSMVCANRSCTQSPGSSSVIAISSRMTPRSASTSSCADQRAGQHVADDVDGQRQVGVEHPRVVAGVLLGREGVHLAADRVDRGGDVQGAAPLRCP